MSLHYVIVIILKLHFPLLLLSCHNLEDKNDRDVSD